MQVPCEKVCDLHVGKMSEDVEAWLVNLMIDNNLLHDLNPNLIASQAQLAFMVHLASDQVYLPCSDQEFFDMAASELTPSMRSRYARSWRITMSVMRSLPLPMEKKKRIIGVCRYRFRQALREHNVISSRLTKRLTNMFLLSQDPWVQRKEASVKAQLEFLKRPDVAEAIDELPWTMPSFARTVDRTRAVLSLVQIARYSALAVNTPRWLDSPPPIEEIKAKFAEAEKAFLTHFEHFWPQISSEKETTALLLADANGGVVYDLCMAKQLLKRSRSVIYAVKEGFFFSSPTIRDIQSDKNLRDLLQNAYICTNPNLSKNELITLLQTWRLVVISDGTRERLNLGRTSVTFARAWKEADFVCGRGWRMRSTLLHTSHSFTRDIFVSLDEEQGFELRYKPRHKDSVKWSVSQLKEFAYGIISKMREAREAGRSVVFYSCIIGSIPGETQRAIKVATTFVASLRERYPGAFIINPGEHFVEGMDGDDLMYMWEQVQRSGYISVWLFQTLEDIETSFSMLNEPVPPSWIGKDSTYSTGCTKEMRIALDVQKANPEMQILGPSADKFFRRDSYGVGKYFDASLSGH